MHEADALIALFDALFRTSESTILVRGGGEPSYEPRDASNPYDRVIFAHGFFASALHEAAHWCLAGKERRLLPDYGYWYKPDSRTEDEQKLFDTVESRPQALEWIFTVAAGRPFEVSADRHCPGGSESEAERLRFEQAVFNHVEVFLAKGLPPRALRMATALSEAFGQGECWRRLASYRFKTIRS